MVDAPVSIRMPRDLVEKLDRIAKCVGKTRSELARELLEAGVRLLETVVCGGACECRAADPCWAVYASTRRRLRAGGPTIS